MKNFWLMVFVLMLVNILAWSGIVWLAATIVKYVWGG